MRTPGSMRGLEGLGRVRLSKSFFFRDFLYSETAAFFGLRNVPDDPSLAIAAGSALCRELLEPLQHTLGRIAIRSGFRSREVTALGNRYGFGASVRNNAAYHVWDATDPAGRMGAGACIVVPWFADEHRAGADWRSLAWFIHDHFDYNHLQFFPQLCAFNVQWVQGPQRRRIDSYINPVGWPTRLPRRERRRLPWRSSRRRCAVH